jgi:hypothetical protein
VSQPSEATFMRDAELQLGTTFDELLSVAPTHRDLPYILAQPQGLHRSEPCGLPGLPRVLVEARTSG